MIDPTIAAECYFLDVGQGTCNIILLGERRAIVIDGGPCRAFSPLKILKDCRVEYLDALVVSHNDDDHCGGAETLLGEYPRQIGQIYFLEDRVGRLNNFLARVRQEEECGNLLQRPRRLEAPRVIYEDYQRRLTLEVMFPEMLDNIDAREREEPNETSGVLVLQCGTRRVVFAGDVEYEQWRALSGDGKYPIVCDVLAAPHHGGGLSARDQARRHEWVYQRALRCKYGVVSVGSVNQPGHPKRVHIESLRKSGAVVLCTQITEQCCDDLERLRPGVIPPRVPGRSKPNKDVSGSGRSRHVACAGTVLVEIGPELVNVKRVTDHQRAVDDLQTTDTGHPLCRVCADATRA